MKTNVYVDGFNLYYGCLRGTPYRWLDLSKLCGAELPKNTNHRIRYFTARVSARPSDPTQPDRQASYLRALATIPNLTIHYGQFLLTKARMPLVSPPAGGPATVEVWKTEEKGTDVVLACHLLLDAFNKDCEAAVVITNDSDLAEPIRIVRKQFGLKVLVLHPLRATPSGKPFKRSVELQKAASKSVAISAASLAASQFPPTVTDAVGTITKPVSW